MGWLGWQGFGLFLMPFFMLVSWGLYGRNELGEDIIKIRSLVIISFLNITYETKMK